MGGNVLLRKKNGNHSLMDSFKMSINEVDHVQDVQINYGAYTQSHPSSKLVEYAFNIENCSSLRDFVLLTKMDFSQEHYIKRHLFGKSFENMECPSLTKCYMRCITIGQTFSDTFSFVDLEKCYIHCSFFKDGGLMLIYGEK